MNVKVVEVQPMKSIKPVWATYNTGKKDTQMHLIEVLTFKPDEEYIRKYPIDIDKVIYLDANL